MRFAAKYKNYSHGVRVGRFMVLADGQHQELSRELRAVFMPAAQILTEPEVLIATDGLNHTGLPIDKNTNQHFSPRSRISGFDTVMAQEANGWTDEERELVEKTLLESGERNRDFILLEDAAVSSGKPWSTYDSTPGERVVGLAQELGIPLGEVLAYEKANRNDAGLVYLMERALAAPVEGAIDAAVVIEA